MLISGIGKDRALGIAILDIESRPNLRSLALICTFPPNNDFKSWMLIWDILVFNGLRAKSNACFIKGFSNWGKVKGFFLAQHDAKGSNETDILDNLSIISGVIERVFLIKLASNLSDICFSLLFIFDN